MVASRKITFREGAVRVVLSRNIFSLTVHSEFLKIRHRYFPSEMGAHEKQKQGENHFPAKILATLLLLRS